MTLPEHSLATELLPLNKHWFERFIEFGFNLKYQITLILPIHSRLPLTGKKPEREACFDFTILYLSMHSTVIVRKDSQRQTH